MSTTDTDTPAAAASKRLLIVEDDEDTADLLCQQLERDGLTIDVARNGQEAILVIGESPPDIIIMDLMMPKLDGFETTRYFKAKFREAFVPILVLTAKGDAPSRARGARFGCEEYMTKPYARKELKAAVDTLLTLSAQENALTLTQRPIEVPEEPSSVDVDDAVAAEVTEPFDAEAAEAARAEAEAELVESITELRVAIAEGQISGGRPEIARVHLERVLELNPDSSRATALLDKLGKGS